MRILDRYIIYRIILTYIVIQACFLGLHLIIDLLATLSDILKARPPFYTIVNYYIYSAPLMFLRTAPFALLLAVLYTLGELNKHNETLAMRASGMSIARLAFILISFPLLISFFSLFIQEKVLIHSQRKMEDIKISHIKKKIESGIGEERNIAFSSKNQLFFIDRFILRNNTLENVMIFESNTDGDIIKKLVCKRIIYERGGWKGYDAVEYILNKKGEIEGRPLYWKEKEINLQVKPQNLTLKRSRFFQFYSLKMLKKEIARLKSIKAHKALSHLLIEFNRKLSEPFCGVFLILGALPFALEIKKRKVGIASFGLGVIFMFVYYVLLSISIAFGKAGILLAVLSPWIAPLFFTTVGIIGIIILR